MARKKPAPKADATAVEAVKHQEMRSNIPTRELGGFVADDEKTPKKVLYPRDPSLDPQLVWKGKDEQDGAPLEVPAVPIYIQEKIHPQALVEELRIRAERGKRDRQLDFFADFNGLDDFATKVDFYHHDQHWSNRMILGDSLLVMTSLAEKERLKGRVQMIYLDPPYGIKFGSNWQVSTRKRDVKDAKAEDTTRQPEQIKAFRDTWQLGIHSYLTYLRDRFTVARELLTESGSIFVQIGDENVHLVRTLMDEVFGSENQAAIITYVKTTSTTGAYLPATSDFILWYAKHRVTQKYRQLYCGKEIGGAGSTLYTQVELADGTRRGMTSEERDGSRELPEGARAFGTGALTSQRVRESRSGYYEVELNGNKYLPTGGEWKTNREGIQRLKWSNRVAVAGKTLAYVRFIDDFPAFLLGNVWTDTVGQNQFGGSKQFVVQTALRVVERCLLMTTDPGDLVFDPTCGSGTTAYVAEQWGRRWITCDTSRVALALARTRLMAAKFPFYLLADSPEGRRKELEISGNPGADAPGSPDSSGAPDVRKGFVYKRVPHVTLKSIANNPDIKEGMSRAAIDAAIRKHAETETLYDQPYEDKGTVRVSGPFTVESLSPHRVLPAADEAPRPAPDGPRDFVATILDNLRKAGVQNTVKGERLTFDRLDAYPGEHLHAEGETTEAGQRRRVAVCIGPEYGTVDPDLIRSAAKEAVQGIGFDLLLVCGFAFDPHVGEVEKQFGRLRVLTPRMNPDLAMGDELLKKTGAGNLFLIFGEPDVTLTKQKDGNLVVEIRGVDVYDPTTGEVRSHGTDDVACWFLDTAYDGESFFVRHAYFCGGNEPYEKLKRALRADVDEAEWSKLYATTSVPFAPPKSGKVAVKVINHYGDEVLKVYAVGK